MAALVKTGEKIARTAAIPHAIAGVLFDTEVTLTGLDPIPQVLVDNAQVRNVVDHPGGLVIQTRNALAGVGIFEIAQPVPDQTADIEFVVEYPGAPLEIAVNGALSPRLSGRSVDAIGV
nr:hypothetical protein [Roseovarius arcticus]